MNMTMRKMITACLLAAFAMSCGSGENKGASSKDSTAISGDSTVSPTPTLANQKGLELIATLDCTTCHELRAKKIGPAYSDVAEKYRGVPHAMDTLVQKVLKGGSGNWGAVPMTPHPNLSDSDARAMVAYILTLKK